MKPSIHENPHKLTHNFLMCKFSTPSIGLFNNGSKLALLSTMGRPSIDQNHKVLQEGQICGSDPSLRKLSIKCSLACCAFVHLKVV